MLHFLFSPEPVSAAALIASTILLTRVHMHARERQYPRFWSLFPASCSRDACVRVWLRFYVCIKINQDLKIYQSCCSRCCAVVKTGRGPYVERRVRAHGGQDIDTEPNNILAYLGKQYVFSWLFPLPAHIFHFTPAEAHLLSSDRRLKHKQMHIPQRKRWKGGPNVLHTTKYKEIDGLVSPWRDM